MAGIGAAQGSLRAVLARCPRCPSRAVAPCWATQCWGCYARGLLRAAILFEKLGQCKYLDDISHEELMEAIVHHKALLAQCLDAVTLWGPAGSMHGSCGDSCSVEEYA